jgi:hypothetical protein
VDRFTVIVDDNCGTTKGYAVDAVTSAAACAMALRIFNAHQSIGGHVQFCFKGAPEFMPIGAHPSDQPPAIIDLFAIAEDTE